MTATNPPSLIAQQRLAVRQQDQQHHHRGLASARRHASTTTHASSPRARANSDAPAALQLNAAAAAMSSQALRNSGALAGRTLAHDALSLERLIRDGPPDGDFESALESARIKVLKQEIKSDSDGMVSCSAIARPRAVVPLTDPRRLASAVQAAHICLAHHARRPGPQHR